MRFVSITRLRIRAIRFLPLFMLQTMQALKQVKKAPGFVGGSLLADRKWTFWTMTVWESEASMRAYMMGGAHRAAMPHLVGWCDEASVVHWDQPDDEMPSWPDADGKMRTDGRPSRVRHPSEGHASLNYAAPRFSAAGPIRSANATPR